MPPKRTARSASRKSTPSSPPKVRDSTRSPRQTRQSAREQSQELGEPAQLHRNNKPLPAVEEEGDTINVSAESHDSNEPDEVDDDDASELVSDGTYSSSGSEDFEALDRDLMIDNLQALYHDSEAILSLVKPQALRTTLKEARDSKSTTSKRLINFHRRLQGNLDAFENRIFLRTGRLVRRLGKRQRKDDETSLSDGKWRPDPVIMKINLALLVLHLLLRDEPRKQDEERRSILQYLSDTDPFPAPFVRLSVPYFRPASTTSEGSVETANIWISILTHWFILSATASSKNKASFDPDQMLLDTFWDAEGTLRRLSTNDEKTQDEASSLLEERANEIRQYFSSTTKKPIDLKALSKRFPWEIFVEELTQWVNLQNSILNQQINAVGGVEAIQDALLIDDYTPFPKPVQETSREPAIRSSFGKRFERMRRRDAQHSAKKPRDERTTPRQSEKAEQVLREGSAAEIPQSPEAGYATAEEVPANLTNDDEDEQIREEVRPEEDPIPTQATNFVLDIVASQAKESNKENIPTPQRRRLLDRQPDAVRETWSDSPEREISPPKRRRAQPESSDDDDDEFEVDRRTPKRARVGTGKARADAQQRTPGRASRPPTSHEAEQHHSSSNPSRSRKRQLPREFLHNDEAEDQATTAAVAGSSSLAPPLRSPPQPSSSRRRTNQPPPPSPPPEEPPPSSYEEIKHLAKANVLSARVHNPFARSTPIYTTHPTTTGPIYYPQVRRPWTAEEVVALITAVGQYGCRWAQILEQDAQRAQPQLQGRNQVQLKDKARNVKLDFLKSRQPLPPGFSAVTISKGHKEMLTEMGMPYVEGRFGDDYVIDD